MATNKFVARNGIVALSDSTITGSLDIAGNLTTTGTITAQKLVVQQVTSSVVFSSGSNVFGNSISNTQSMTGSVNITGSLDVVGEATFSNNLEAGATGGAVTKGDLFVDSTSLSSTVYVGRLSSTSNDNTNFVVRNRVGEESFKIVGNTGAATFSSNVAGLSYRVNNSDGNAIGYLLRQGAWVGGGSTATNLSIAAETGNGISFYVNGSSAGPPMFLNTSGNLGVNNSSPSYKLDVGGTIYASSDMRAPIFYDSDNTAFYGDFASTSRINTIQLDTLRGPQGDWLLGYQSGKIYSFGSSAEDDTLNIDFNNVYFNPGTGALGNRYFRLNKGGSNDGGFLLSRDNALDWQIVNITDTGNLIFYSYGSGTNVLTLNRSGGAVTATGDMRSPIFYDSNNTGYYLDPASTSNLNSVNITTLNGHTLNSDNYLGRYGNSYYQGQTWIQFNGNHGLYWPAYYGAHFYPNNYNSYTQFRLDGSKNGYGGIVDSYSAVTGIMYDSGGNGGVYREANSRWYFYYVVSDDCMGIGTSSTSSTYSLYLNKGVYAQSRIDATIFYDTNNTAYYFDGTNPVDSIRVSGNIVAYYSDERLKDIKENIPNAIEKVQSLNGFYYEPNEKAQRLGYIKKLEIGVSAQEVERILPEIIKDAPIGHGYKTLDYGKLTPLLIEAIKEQQTQIEELKQLVNNITKS